MANDTQNQNPEAENEDAHGVDGERGIASITSGKGPTITDKQKKIIAMTVLAFLAALAFMSWPRGDEPPEEPEERDTITRIRPATDFQPAEIAEPEPEPQPQPAAPAAEPQPERPKGPIERAREDAGQDPEMLTEAEQLLQSSQRAPLMAYAGTQTPSLGGATEGAGSAASGMFGGGSNSGAGNSEGSGLTGLAASLATSTRSGVKATRIAHPDLTITEGSMIPCSLDTAMDSTTPGMVRCTVTDDVYSAPGTVVLLERGTRITGEYRGGVQRGQKRMFVIWNRAQTPEGVVVQLSSPATDALGRSGVTGDLDTQFWTRFGGTMMLSIIDTGLVALANQYEDSEDASNNVSELAQTELDNVIDVPVIMRKNQGEEVAVMVARDLDFSGVYSLK